MQVFTKVYQALKSDSLHDFIINLILLLMVSIFFRAFFSFKIGYFEKGIFVHGLLSGIRFDLAISAGLSFLFSTFSLIFRSKWVFYFSYLILLTTLFSDLIYFLESGRHISYEIWNLASIRSEIFDQASQNWSYILISLLISYGLTKLYFLSSKPHALKFTTVNFIGFIISLTLSIFLIRGGVSGIPQSPLFAYRVSNYKVAQISLNGSCAIFLALSQVIN